MLNRARQTILDRVRFNTMPIGYGRHASGGKELIVVGNEKELRRACKVQNAHVVASENLTDVSLGLTDTLHIGSRVTVNFKLAPGLELYPDYDNGFPSTAKGSKTKSAFLVSLNDKSGNSNILNHVSLDGKRSTSYDKKHPSYNTGGFNVRHNNVWLRHCTAERLWDDAFLFGAGGNNITMSYCKTRNTDKGVSAYYKSPKSMARISIMFCDIAAKQRLPFNKGAFIHLLRNYIHDSTYGAVDAENHGSQSVTFAEANYLENCKPVGMRTIVNTHSRNLGIAVATIYTLDDRYILSNEYISNKPQRVSGTVVTGNYPQIDYALLKSVEKLIPSLDEIKAHAGAHLPERELSSVNSFSKDLENLFVKHGVNGDTTLLEIIDSMVTT